MSTVIPKKQMTEEDIKLQYITPALTSKWDKGKITMETQVTDGKINLKGNFVFREKPKRADYILYLNANNPIAIIEAKDNKHSISHGLQQAMAYAQMLDLPFAYSSNGDGFAEHDCFTNASQSHPFPSLRNIKRHLVCNAHRLVFTDFLIRQIIRTTIDLNKQYDSESEF